MSGKGFPNLVLSPKLSVHFSTYRNFFFVYLMQKNNLQFWFIYLVAMIFNLLLTHLFHPIISHMHDFYTYRNLLFFSLMYIKNNKLLSIDIKVE